MTKSALSPAESHFLVDPARDSNVDTFRVTVLELLVGGVLGVEKVREKGLLFGYNEVSHLRVLAELPPSAPPHHSAVVDIVRAAQAAGGSMQHVIDCAKRTFGDRLATFNAQMIVPGLTALGLVEEVRWLKLFRSCRLTAAGKAESLRIKAALAQARTLPALLKRDPVEAAQLALGLGSIVLLAGELLPHYAGIATAIRAIRYGTDGGTDTLALPSDSLGVGSATVGDFGALDFGTFDAGAFSVLDSGLDAFDAAIGDSGGSGDTGGGGGGD